MQDVSTPTPTPNEGGIEYARRLFMDDLSLSIDDVEKVLNRFRIGIPKHEVSRVRMEVRQRIENAQAAAPVIPIGPQIRRHQGPEQKQAPIVVRPRPRAPEPFNPPRIVFKVVKPAVEPEAVVQQQPLPPPVVEHRAPEPPPVAALGPEPREPTVAEKRAWLESWMLDHPSASVNAAREALREHFKTTMNTTTIAEVVRITHELAGTPTKPGRPATKPAAPEEVQQQHGPIPFGAEVAELAHRMRALGVRKIEVVGNHYRVVLDERH